MESHGRVKNVMGGEAIFRFVTGVILIILAFLGSDVFRWVSGIIGMVLILTAIFGY